MRAIGSGHSFNNLTEPSFGAGFCLLGLLMPACVQVLMGFEHHTIAPRHQAYDSSS